MEGERTVGRAGYISWQTNLSGFIPPSGRVGLGDMYKLRRNPCLHRFLFSFAICCYHNIYSKITCLESCLLSKTLINADVARETERMGHIIAGNNHLIYFRIFFRHFNLELGSYRGPIMLLSNLL